MGHFVWNARTVGSELLGWGFVFLTTFETFALITGKSEPFFHLLNKHLPRGSPGNSNSVISYFGHLHWPLTPNEAGSVVTRSLLTAAHEKP